jgi:hypothetical protein
MTRLNPNFLLATAVGAAASIATAITAPQFVGGGLAFTGGLIGGAAIAKERSLKASLEQEQTARVTQTFTSLYEINRGIIEPVQLAFLSNIPLSRADAFLTTLAEANNGQKVTVQDGLTVVFAFPHSSAALDELTQNAQKWAAAQTQQLNDELLQHKKLIQVYQMQAQQQLQVKASPSPWENVSPT